MTPQKMRGGLNVVSGRGRSLTASQQKLVGIFLGMLRDLPSEQAADRRSKQPTDRTMGEQELIELHAVSVYYSLMAYHKRKMDLKETVVPNLLPSHAEYLQHTEKLRPGYLARATAHLYREFHS
jgi:hypothetical protein